MSNDVSIRHTAIRTVLAMDDLYDIIYSMDASANRQDLLDERMQLVNAMRTIKKMFEITDADLIDARCEVIKANYRRMLETNKEEN